MYTGMSAIMHIQGTQHEATSMDANMPRIQSSRGHLTKMGAIAAPAIVATLMKSTVSAAGGNNNGPGKQNNNGPGNNNNDNKSCFMKGTNIRTAEGDTKVEDLTWEICSRRFSVEYAPWVKDVLPVRVTKSALGPHIPDADVCITQAQSGQGRSRSRWCAAPMLTRAQPFAHNRGHLARKLSRQICTIVSDAEFPCTAGALTTRSVPFPPIDHKDRNSRSEPYRVFGGGEM
jgi:hypothetical protein